MKKKNFLITKTKKKFIFAQTNFKRLFIKQLSFKYGPPQTVLSFFKKFQYIDLTTSYRIIILLGCKPNYRINNFNYKDRTILWNILRLKFYLNYSFIKQKKFELLKTLVTFKTLRYYFSLPLRGQRTKTNAKTRKKYNMV